MKRGLKERMVGKAGNVERYHDSMKRGLKVYVELIDKPVKAMKLDEKRIESVVVPNGGRITVKYKLDEKRIERLILRFLHLLLSFPQLDEKRIESSFMVVKSDLVSPLAR